MHVALMACADIDARFAVERVLSKPPHVSPEAQILEMFSGELLERRAKWRKAENMNESDPTEQSKDDDDWVRGKRARAAREFHELGSFYATRFAGLRAASSQRCSFLASLLVTFAFAFCCLLVA